MGQDNKNVNKIIRKIEKVKTIESYAKQLAPLSKAEINALDHTSISSEATLEGQNSRIQFLNEKGLCTDSIIGDNDINTMESLKGNIENFIGMAQIPIGLAGTLLMNGANGTDGFFIPMATTEGALVASDSRGMKACRLSGGITSVCLSEGVQRSPFFKFDNIVTVALFIRWVHEKMDVFRFFRKSSGDSKF